MRGIGDRDAGSGRVEPQSWMKPRSRQRQGGLVGWVAPGDCSPGAPTDPDVPNSGIRFVGPWPCDLSCYPMGLR